MRTLQLLVLGFLFTSTITFACEVRRWSFHGNPEWDTDMVPDDVPRGAMSFEIMFISDGSSFSCVTAIGNNLSHCGNLVAKDCYAITREPNYSSNRLGFKETFGTNQSISAMDIYDSENNHLCMITVGNGGQGDPNKCFHFDVKCIHVGSAANPAISGTK